MNEFRVDHLSIVFANAMIWIVSASLSLFKHAFMNNVAQLQV